MNDFFDTCEVTVVRRVASGEDEMGEPTYVETREQVGDVLFAPGGTSALSESFRAAGYVVDAEFHFPKTFRGDLSGCAIELDGESYEVVGKPERYMSGNTPGRWNMQVEGRRVDG